MWWINSSAATHISVSMQGCLTCRKPNDGERYIYVGDGKKVEVEAIEKFRLLLKPNFIWILMKHLLFRLLEEILFPFPFWTNMVILVYLETENSFCFMNQNLLILILCPAMIIFIYLKQLLHLMNPCK